MNGRCSWKVGEQLDCGSSQKRNLLHASMTLFMTARHNISPVSQASARSRWQRRHRKWQRRLNAPSQQPAASAAARQARQLAMAFWLGWRQQGIWQSQ